MSLSLRLLLALTLASRASTTSLLGESNTTLPDVCKEISSSISSASKVYFPGTFEYARVEPATAQDVGKTLQILGQTRTPFGVKSGGHCTNPGFSSSPGVLISMFGFGDVKYDLASQTALIGTGLIFDDVYAALAPYNVSVLGARATGIGVGGFALGGGYAWKTGQYGLTIDTITAVELVKPDGEVVTVTEASDPELFFGLKGGFNNFGIVTRITMRTYPQTSVWAGGLIFPLEQASNIRAAILKFANTNTDPKSISAVYIFYDAPKPPKGLFDDFFTFPSLYKDVHERSFHDFIQSTPLNVTANFRIVFHTVPLLEYSQNVIKVVEDEAQTRCAKATSDTIPFISYNVEPFLPTILNHSESSSAYPPTRGKAYSPFNLYFGWENEQLDGQVFNEIKTSAARVRDAAIADGQDIANASLYPNYALFDTPLNQMYGNNSDRLRTLRQRVDPSNVMGLAGGFRF